MSLSLETAAVPPHAAGDAWIAGETIVVPTGFTFSPAAARDAAQRVRMHAAFTQRKPAASRLPFSYQFVPQSVRTSVGHLLGSLQRRRAGQWARFPRWPVDLSADFLADLGAERSPFAGGPAPVLLSHDIDTAEGLRNLVPRFLPLEEAVGARSANYVVPCSWEIDHGLLAEAFERGHEIGIHGYDHSNKTPYAAPDELRARVHAARPLIERYGITGYRAPSLVRTPQLLEALAEIYRYDTSIPTSGGLFPVPNNGCASARPFRAGAIAEIPLSMPRDGSLRFLGHAPREILDIWKTCAQRIARSGGVVSLLTHCEERFSGNSAMLAVYREFLDFLAADSRFAFSTTAEVLQRAGI